MGHADDAEEYFRVSALSQTDKLALAESRHATPLQLHILANPENGVKTLTAVAANRNTAERTQLKLVQHPDMLVVSGLINNTNATSKVLQTIYETHIERWIDEEYLDPNLIRLASHHNFPTETLLAMLRNPSSLVRRAACRSGYLPEPEAFRVAHEERNSQVLMSLAKGKLSPRTIRTLISQDFPDMLVILAGNSLITSVQADAILKKLSGSDYALALSYLAANQNLTPEQYRIIFENGKGVGRYLLENNPKTPPEVRQRLKKTYPHVSAGSQ